MTLVIEGAPRTKKTSNRIVRVKGRPLVLPSKQHTVWERSAIVQLTAQACEQVRRFRWAGEFGLVGPVNCRALIYREARRGDAVNYYQAIADVLERAGVVENDRLIVSWDGSRLLVDRHCPRVEITLTALDAP